MSRLTSLGGGRKLDLGLLGSLSDSLNGHSVLGQIQTRLLLELLDEVGDELDVEVLSSQVGVTIGGLDLEDSLLHLKNGNIEGSSSEIVDGDDRRIVLVKTVSESGGSGLVDDSENLKTGDGTSVSGSLSLRVVEVGGDGDN